MSVMPSVLDSIFVPVACFSNGLSLTACMSFSLAPIGSPPGKKQQSRPIKMRSIRKPSCRTELVLSGGMESAWKEGVMETQEAQTRAELVNVDRGEHRPGLTRSVRPMSADGGEEPTPATPVHEPLVKR